MQISLQSTAIPTTTRQFDVDANGTIDYTITLSKAADASKVNVEIAQTGKKKTTTDTMNPHGVALFPTTSPDGKFSIRLSSTLVSLEAKYFYDADGEKGPAPEAQTGTRQGLWIAKGYGNHVVLQAEPNDKALSKECLTCLPGIDEQGQVADARLPQGEAAAFAALRSLMAERVRLNGEKLDLVI